jgi:hypothetical protein
LNKNIIKARNKRFIILVLINFFLFFSIGITFLFLNIFSAATPEKMNFDSIKNIITISFVFIFLIVNVLFCIKKIYPLNKTAKLTPKICKIEDFVIHVYRRNGDRECKVYPLVKDIETGKLYFTFGDYNLSYYKYMYLSQSSTNVTVNVLRSDKSIVKIGDTALFYINETITPKIKIDENNNFIKLNGEKIKYLHVNPSYNINIFNSVEFFKGVLEIDNLDNI